ncbi:TNT domain-containing protein [Actinosynnema sp. NPDC020468]|uniref:TNT domain-containing protein n=1 Tax=Actinosynnema sp. NPDC020468 TaxID=3154488 RepID=UPI003402CCB4
MTAPEPVLTIEDQNAILGSVTTLLVQRLPGDWEQLWVDLRLLGSHLEVESNGVTIFGRAFAWDLPDEALPILLQLRDGMATSTRGAWYSMKLHLVHPDTYSVEFNRDREPDWTSPPEPRHRDEELAAYPRPADQTPEWLAPAPAAEPVAQDVPLYDAPVFDGTDPNGRPTYDRPAVHPQERDEVLAYLEGAPVVLAARSYGPDPLDPDATPAVPQTFHTDGVFVWQGGVPFQLRTHAVPPVPQLVQHIRDNGYALPAVDPAAETAAAAVATGQAQSAPLPLYEPRVITDADRRALEKLRERLEYYGVGEDEYGIVEPKRDALVVEPAPGREGWQVQFWDGDRGPTGHPTVFTNAADAAKVLLADLLWRDDLDQVRSANRGATPTAAIPVQPVSDIQPMPDEPPLSLFRDREPVVLEPGAELDRFGPEEGNLVYAAGTMFGNRSLPPDWLNRRYHVYRVAKPVPALKGVAVPWFGQPGGGTGYFLAESVRALLASGSLVEVPEVTTEPPAPRV